MFLKTRQDGALMEVLNVHQLFDPFVTNVEGRLHAGEEMQDRAPFLKADLRFPSGEALPRCWMDPAYKLHAAPVG
ncbi:acetyltransferase [Cyanobium sp. NIES-981]|uniref:acetyltransferase n=1 Tax=Cyanobium sp. NIES-981 TaxID=1851505 RepID=UPI0007DCBB5D|nr:acetyltransferase [Cyanobium sp. NIES-981]SBO42189.1 conserved protein of unknown function [Cyanobium sp. NIES-981]